MRLSVFLSSLKPYKIELRKRLVGEMAKISLCSTFMMERTSGLKQKFWDRLKPGPGSGPVGAQCKNSGPRSGPGPRFVVRFFPPTINREKFLEMYCFILKLKLFLSFT